MITFSMAKKNLYDGVFLGMPVESQPGYQDGAQLELNPDLRTMAIQDAGMNTPTWTGAVMLLSTRWKITASTSRVAMRPRVYICRISN
jgi:hypothetical protein